MKAFFESCRGRTPELTPTAEQTITQLKINFNFIERVNHSEDA